MALLENLEHPNWQDFLKSCFTHTLYILTNDPFAPVGSAVSDLKSWFQSGGLPKVKERLNEQMQLRQFSEEQMIAINDFLLQLIQEHRSTLISLTLIVEYTPPVTLQEVFQQDGATRINVTTILKQLVKRERPFEDWMYAHGHSEKDIREVYGVIDRWLVQDGILPNRLN